jgi:hypothetical protein
VGFESKISRGTVLVDIGVNQLQNNGEIFSGTFVALKLDRELSASSGLTLALAQR